MANLEIEEKLKAAISSSIKETFAGIQTQAQPFINASALAPASQISYASPAPAIVPDVSKLNETLPLTITPEETKQSDLNKRLQELNNQLIGKFAYKTEQEIAQGIPELNRTQKDLEAQLKALTNEALAIPLQLQQMATGRGITADGLAPIQAGALRENAIKALSVNSLLEASRGNLAYANDLVGKAVATKYDPIDEEIKAKTANLDLIIKSPKYTIAEKNRAQAQKDIQDKKKETLDKEKEDAKNIYAVALKAAENKANALTLQKILNAKTSTKALTIATEARVMAKPAKPKIDKANIQTTLYNVGIPTSVSTEKGVLNKSYYDKAISAELTPETVNGLWQNIIAGNTFEDIRQGIRDQGGDPAILDIFVQVLQKQGGGKIVNPF